jgi:hypothetical protein
LAHPKAQEYLVLPNNIIFTREHAELLFGIEITESIMDFCERLNNLKLKEPESAILFALIFTNYSKKILI